MINSDLQDRMRRIEVTMGKMITHSRDLGPRYRRLGYQQCGWQGFDGLPDLQQPDTDGVEDQPVRQIAAAQMRTNRLDRRLHVEQPLVIAVSHSAISSSATVALMSGLRSDAGITSTGASTMASRSARSRPSPNRPIPAGRSASRSMSLLGPS